MELVAEKDWAKVGGVGRVRGDGPFLLVKAVEGNLARCVFAGEDALEATIVNRQHLLVEPWAN